MARTPALTSLSTNRKTTLLISFLFGDLRLRDLPNRRSRESSRDHYRYRIEKAVLRVTMQVYLEHSNLFAQYLKKKRKEIGFTS